MGPLTRLHTKESENHTTKFNTEYTHPIVPNIHVIKYIDF